MGIFPVSMVMITIHHSPFCAVVTEHYRVAICQEDCSGGWEVQDEGVSFWSFVGSSCCTLTQ